MSEKTNNNAIKARHRSTHVLKQLHCDVAGLIWLLFSLLAQADFNVDKILAKDCCCNEIDFVGR